MRLVRLKLLLLVPLALAACGKPQTSAAPEAQKRWFVSAANPYAVEAGAAILSRGGSAVDAAGARDAGFRPARPPAGPPRRGRFPVPRGPGGPPS